MSHNDILDHDAIRTRIKSVVREAVGRWPTDDGVEMVLAAMINERDRTGVYLTPVAKKALSQFRAGCGLDGPHPGRLEMEAPAVAIITLARETEGSRGGHGGHGGAGL